MSRGARAGLSGFARSHGCTPSWCAAMLALTVCSGGAQWLMIPGGAPAASDATGLETVGTLLAVSLAGGIGELFTSRCAELEASSARDLRPLRAAVVAVAGALCVISSACIVSLAPPQISFAAVLRTYMLVCGLFLAAAQVSGSGAAAGLTVLVVASHSVGGLVPWEANLLFNPELAAPAVTGATAAWCLVLLRYVFRPRRAADGASAAGHG